MSTVTNWRLELAPEGRINPTETWILQQNPTLSSVIAIISNFDSEPQLLLTRRVGYSGVHGGQMSFPGGKHEVGETLLETALRETKEEVGMNIDKNNIVQSLQPLYIPPSNHWVHPFVAVLPDHPEVTIQKEEVAYYVWVPWEKIETAKIVYETLDQGRIVPGFYFDNDFVWGATAMLLNEIRKTLLL